MTEIRLKVVPSSFLRNAKSNESGTNLEGIWYEFVPMEDFEGRNGKKNVRPATPGGGINMVVKRGYASMIVS